MSYDRIKGRPAMTPPDDEDLRQRCEHVTAALFGPCLMLEGGYTQLGVDLEMQDTGMLDALAFKCSVIVQSRTACPCCGNESVKVGSNVVLCYSCTMDKAQRADEKALYGGPEL